MGRYALRLMVVVARKSKENGTPVKLSEIAQRAPVSKSYLEQVAKHLKNTGLLKAISGKNGGYLLGRPAESITMEQIIEAAIGPINIVDCIHHPESCELIMDASMCECRKIFQLANRQLKNLFSSFTLEDLADKKVAEIVEQKAMSA